MDLSSPLIAIPLFVALLFLVVGSPVVYGWTDAYLGGVLKMSFVEGGVPTRVGLIAHSAVMFLGMYAYLKAYSPEVHMY